jgi:hypothetical protein
MYCHRSPAVEVCDSLDIECKPATWTVKPSKNGKATHLVFEGRRVAAVPIGDTEQIINGKLDDLCDMINEQPTEGDCPLIWDLCTYTATTVEGSRPDGVGYDGSVGLKSELSHLAYFELKKPGVALGDAAKGRDNQHRYM